ncbi:hypothetical protein BDY17DRAFT_292114 [Neohortaea acidophila]|uniref:G-patch domain-containing protein n=1 Tax=Neohortaea acidophila TaxID=245834 RepID=A0A6A6Q2N3_9PEZI|nr:uncharacterized protein BDY17DRAFT_292114 [Neohortaea acidophila]KAF2486788.1 hypothetical protein BDY17DRAFT_292114 [Neohortaea acidophila]
MSNKRSRAAFESTSDRPPPHAPYVLYGTPLPPYDPKANDDGSYVPVWKQEVTDEHGRKRLHGAFTGGWSAGYFNTVGSKEGWTPASFVSSRTNRAKTSAEDGGGQKAEDFMDEEDLAELAESQKLETQGTFAGLGGNHGDKGKTGGMFADLFRPTGETMGVKLLQRMGWKQGQGIGPKVKRRIQGDTKGEMHLFAPEDSKVIGFHRKTDRKGLGYAGEARLNANHHISNADSDDEEKDARILHANRSKVLTKPPKLKKSGLGLGVLNDTGSDEEDEYSIGPQISYNRVIGGDKQKKKKAGLGANPANSTLQKPVITSKKLTQRTSTLSGFRKCHDGRLPIDGFILSLAPLSISEENKHAPPTPPEGWQPAKLLATQQPTSTTPSYQSTSDAAKASTLDPKARAALLGEQALPGKSVFDFLSPAARDRLAAASGKTNLPPARGESAPTPSTTSTTDPDTTPRTKTLWDLIPPLDRAIAAAALQRGTTGWMPYSEDEAKRARYRAFLELRAGLETNLPPRPKTFSLDEWAKEMSEFAQAAQVFKPVSGLMASRFTSASASAPRLASDAPDSTSAGDGTKEEDPAEKAARMGMYGPMTRSRIPFFPPRLLCKRFNVRPPANVGVDPGGEGGEGGGARVGENRRLDVVSQASLDRMMSEASFKSGGAAGGGFTSAGVEGGEDQSGQRRQWATVDAERNDALEASRAGEEVFKAVFGNDDET